MADDGVHPAFDQLRRVDVALASGHATLPAQGEDGQPPKTAPVHHMATPVTLSASMPGLQKTDTSTIWAIVSVPATEGSTYGCRLGPAPRRLAILHPLGVDLRLYSPAGYGNQRLRREWSELGGERDRG